MPKTDHFEGNNYLIEKVMSYKVLYFVNSANLHLNRMLFNFNICYYPD